MPAFFRRNDANALVATPIEVFGRVARATQTDLYHAVRINQTFFDGTAKWRTVRDFFTKHFVVHISVRIDVNNADWLIEFFAQRP